MDERWYLDYGQVRRRAYEMSASPMSREGLNGSLHPFL